MANVGLSCLLGIAGGGGQKQQNILTRMALSIMQQAWLLTSEKTGERRWLARFFILPDNFASHPTAGLLRVARYAHETEYACDVCFRKLLTWHHGIALWGRGHAIARHPAKAHLRPLHWHLSHLHWTTCNINPLFGHVVKGAGLGPWHCHAR